MEVERDEIKVGESTLQAIKNEDNEKLVDNKNNIHSIPGWTSLVDNDVQLQVIVEGNGNMPDTGEKVHFRYHARCYQTKKLFESRELRTRLGDEDIPAGLEIALGHLPVQSRSLVFCSPKFAYGPSGRRCQNSSVNRAEFQGIEDIPENSAIEFEVFLLGIDKRTPKEFSPKERIEESFEKRKLGNYHWYFGFYPSACRCYEKGLELIDWTVFPTNSEYYEQAINTAVSIGNNLTLIQMKSKDCAKAKTTIEKILEICPRNVKSLFLLAKCLIELEHFEEAKLNLEKAINEGEKQSINQQEMTEIKRTLENLKKTVRQYREKQKKMFSFMREKFSTSSTPTSSTAQKEENKDSSQIIKENKKKKKIPLSLYITSFCLSAFFVVLVYVLLEIPPFDI